jgi:hypothetical protein
MICSKCGSNCADDTKFCPICGNRFPVPGEAPVAGFSTAADNVSQSTPNTQQTYNQGYGYQTNPNLNPGYNQYVNPGDINEGNLPDSLKPLSPWAYLGYYCLFSMIPCAGIILAFVFAFGSNENVNRRNFARFYLLMLAIGVVISLMFMILFGSLFASVFREIQQNLPHGGYYY